MAAPVWLLLFLASNYSLFERAAYKFFYALICLNLSQPKLFLQGSKFHLKQKLVLQDL